MIHAITHWRNRATGNNVYVCSDSHIDFKNQKITKQQLDALITAAQYLQAHVIFEGMLDYAGEHPLVQKFVATYPMGIATAQLAQLPQAADATFDPELVTGWQQGIEATPLFKLGARLNAASLPSTNVEFRQLSIASASGHAIAYAQIAEEIQKIITQLQAYQDTPEHAAFYQERIDTFTNKNSDLLQEGFLKLKLNVAESFMQFHSQRIIRSVLFSQELLDALAVHALYTQRATKEVIMVLGADHCTVINGVLPQLGYERVNTWGGPYWRSADNIRIALCPIDVRAALTPHDVVQPAWHQRVVNTLFNRGS